MFWLMLLIESHDDEPVPPLDQAQIRSVLDALIANPWNATFAKMRFVYSDPWEPLDLRRAVAAAVAGHSIELVEGDDKTDPATARLSPSDRPWVGLYVGDSMFGPDGLALVHEALDALLAVMPPEVRASVRVGPFSTSEWFERMGIPPLPKDIFGDGLPWLVALDVKSQVKLGKLRDDLFVSSTERNGRRWLQLYDEPFDVEREATRQRIEKIVLSLRG